MINVLYQFILQFLLIDCGHYISGSVIRTTHVTGTFTDIGIIFGRLLRGKTEDLWKLKILFPLAFGFILGAVLSGVFFSYVISYVKYLYHLKNAFFHM
jgi:uncharacterized membrane protein YoaK (UPF0700 family)